MSPTVSEFKSVIDSCCLSQHIDFPTHLHGHTLDLLMAPSEFSAISDVKGSDFISDHKIIISRRALAREGDYEMMPVCACVRVCVR